MGVALLISACEPIQAPTLPAVSAQTAKLAQSTTGFATVRGIWLNVAAIFAVGQKSNQTMYYASLTYLWSHEGLPHVHASPFQRKQGWSTAVQVAKTSDIDHITAQVFR